MDVISSTAIQQLKSHFPTTSELLGRHAVLDHPWYLIAVVAFSAARQPEAAISVYKVVLEGLRAHGNGDVNVEDHVTLVKRIQEALLKASLINGIPRAATTLLLLNSTVPKSILDKLSTPSRDFTKPLSDLTSDGRQFFNEAYGEVEGAKAQGFIDAHSPDFGIYAAASCGLILGHSSVLSFLETSYILISASILNDSPREASWYYLAAMRHGATIDQTKRVREMALKVASLSDARLREVFPEVVPQELIQPY
ncbi:hypothetical protein ONZ45_g6330 [Pleurotus djamor]|nr:hypothetical protein ONZ45_g6330 [Pleurotus djamor]